MDNIDKIFNTPVDRRDVLRTLGLAGAVAVEFALDPIAEAVAQTARAPELPQLTEARQKAEGFRTKLLQDAALKTGTREQAFELVAGQPLLPDPLMYSSESLKPFYPHLSPTGSTTDRNANTEHVGTKTPVVSLKFPIAGRESRAVGLRTGPNTMMVPASLLKDLRVPAGIQALEQGFLAGLQMKDFTGFYADTPVVRMGFENKRQLHGSYAAVATYAHDPEQNRNVSTKDGGVLLDPSQAPALRKLIIDSIMELNPKSKRETIERVIDNNLILTSAGEEVMDRVKGALGSPVWAAKSKGIAERGDTRFALAGTIQAVFSVKSANTPGAPETRLYLVGGPETHNYALRMAQ